MSLLECGEEYAMSETLSITLPANLADLVRAKVASGHYADASEVIVDSLISLQDRDSELEPRVWAEAVAAYDAYRANPSETHSAEDVRVYLDALFAADVKAGKGEP
jgi:antitoxin ParD1/3/4